MSRSYFDRNQNLQIHGDVNFFSSGGTSYDDHSFVHITQEFQAANGHARTLERGFKILCDNTAPSARYGYGHAFTGPQCHPGTRVAVQDHIFQWFESQDGQIAMWMKGPVGIGKSAIAQTISHLAAQRRQLSSAFFFFRSDDTRNSAKHLVPTLTYEMTQQMPRTLDSVCRAIGANPLVFSSPLDLQINSILLRPLHRPNESSLDAPMLIVIDGLDECLDTNVQQAIIWSFISSLLSASTETVRHKLLIVSRPESHISSAFSAPNIRAHVKHFSLDLWDTEDDIGKFLRDKLQEIKDTHPMKHHLPIIWPDEDSFCKLRARSVGSFAYASAVVRFLASHKRTPENALQDILSLRSLHGRTAFADLDALYRHILSSLDSEIYFTVQKILCLYLYSRRGDISLLAAGLSEEQSVLEIALIHIPSLVHFDDRQMKLKLYHSSFGEFLGDKERSGEHHVFSSHVVSAVVAALSNVWLHPVHGHDKYRWFSIMNTSMTAKSDVDMDILILNTLVETQISASIINLEQTEREAIVAVTGFFRAIRNHSTWSLHPNPTFVSLCQKAFNVVCIWLWSYLSRPSEGPITLSETLDIFLENDEDPAEATVDGYAGSLGLRGFVRMRDYSFDFLYRLFPELAGAELCSGIVDKYLALPSCSRKLDLSRESSTSASLYELYERAVTSEEAMEPAICHKLEQIVLDGRKALDAILSQQRTSKHCIFYVLFGEEWHFFDVSKLNMDIDTYERSSLFSTLLSEHIRIVEKTDCFVRAAHAKIDFAYISEDVKILYCSKQAGPHSRVVW